MITPYHQLSVWGKRKYWARAAIRMIGWIVFCAFFIRPYEEQLWLAETHTFEEFAQLKNGGTGKMSIQYLFHDAQIQAKQSVVQGNLMLGWLWQIYMLYSEIIFCLKKKMRYIQIQDTMRHTLISLSIVICAWSAYFVAL